MAKTEQALVAIIMGSDSDLAVMSEAAKRLEAFDVPYELSIVSAHRTPQRLFDYARGARKRGLRVIIAGAGGAAHLPGMVASLTSLPVIGVPVRGKVLDGMDSLLSIVQMPSGIPVACVAVDNAANAGLLALRILSTADDSIAQKMESFQTDLESQVLEKAGKLEKIGWKAYLKE